MANLHCGTRSGRSVLLHDLRLARYILKQRSLLHCIADTLDLQEMHDLGCWMPSGLVHQTRYTDGQTRYTVHPTRYTVHQTRHTVHQTRYTVHETRHTVHATLYTDWMPACCAVKGRGLMTAGACSRSRMYDSGCECFDDGPDLLCAPCLERVAER